MCARVAFYIFTEERERGGLDTHTQRQVRCHIMTVIENNHPYIHSNSTLSFHVMEKVKFLNRSIT